MLDLRKHFFVVSLEMADERLEQLKIWLSKASSYGLELGSLQPASADASFRRYFRISGMGSNDIAAYVHPSGNTPGFDYDTRRSRGEE